jgi:hypothetical protein
MIAPRGGNYADRGANTLVSVLPCTVPLAKIRFDLQRIVEAIREIGHAYHKG